jgi:DNA-binding transcriptional MerR regulator
MTVVYKSGDVMKKLGLKESVFKKYYLALEKEGYSIQKNSSNHRVFTEEDIQTLETFMQLIKYDGMTVESVAKKIGEMKGHNVVTEEKSSHDVMSLIAIALEEQAKKFELQKKEDEQKLIERMQEVQAKKFEEVERQLEEIKSSSKEAAASSQRIEEHLVKKSWWRKLWQL